MRTIGKNVSSRLTGLFGRIGEMLLLPWLTPVAVSCFSLPLSNCFLRVWIPKFICSCLEIFSPKTTSAISNTANSNRLASSRFAAETTFYGKNGTAILPITCASALNSIPRCRPVPQKNGISTYLEATILQRPIAY